MESTLAGMLVKASTAIGVAGAFAGADDRANEIDRKEEGRDRCWGPTSTKSELKDIAAEDDGSDRGTTDNLVVPAGVEAGGSITTAGAVTLGSGAVVDGSISAGRSVILDPDAEVNGTIEADGIVRIASNAAIDDDVVGQIVEIEPDADISGEISCSQCAEASPVADALPSRLKKTQIYMRICVALMINLPLFTM